MTTDPYKAMTVQYNHLNLPKKMTFDNDYIEITYDAAGTKLRKVVGNNAILTGGGGTEKSMNGKEGEKGKDDNAPEAAASAGPPTNYYTQDYLGGFEYRDGTREAIYTAEGRLFNNAGTNRYEYTIKDHLGNARISFTDKNGNNTIEYSNGEVLQENHYYPFGLAYEGPWVNDAARDNKYQYNGKEINDEFGLNWYNYGKRWYDAAVGRFPNIDPIADQFAFVTPYNYAENEPIKHIDLWGLQKAVYDVRSKAGDNFNSVMSGLVKVAEHLVNDLKGSGVTELKTGLTRIDAALTLASISSTVSNQTLTEQSKNENLTALAIGEGASFYNPMLGFAVGGLIQDATNEDGLTNLKNGRMAEAYSQGFNQTVNGNVHLQNALKRIAQTENGEISSEDRVGYYTRKYAEIDVATDKHVNGRVVTERQKFYDGSDMYNTLTSPSNAPGKPGHNPTTSFGVEVFQYQKQKKE